MRGIEAEARHLDRLASGAFRASVHAMNARQIATVHAGGRVAVGAALTLAPSAAAAGWIGEDAGRPAVTAVTRAVGVRDGLMGLGVLSTLHDADAAKSWLAACLVADTVDLGATLIARDNLPKQGVVAVAVVAAASAALGAWLLSALD